MEVLSQSQLSMTNQQPITFKHDQLIANHQRARGRISINMKSRELMTMISDTMLKGRNRIIKLKSNDVNLADKEGGGQPSNFRRPGTFVRRGMERKLDNENVEQIFQSGRFNRRSSKIAGFGWLLMLHPAYSPDLALSDFYLFRILESFLRGKIFESDVILLQAVRGWFRVG
ncbi:nas-30 [Cordylochernes scorpioides]|uniref:Nas-30 n=1 Tax=Cordylochernes scorpioides TaxID=51811 RepID=A0ABY6KE14_9ARAC|nr:nas-30 [Cordylochernes scorpioides]